VRTQSESPWLVCIPRLIAESLRPLLPEKPTSAAWMSPEKFILPFRLSSEPVRETLGQKITWRRPTRGPFCSGNVQLLRHLELWVMWLELWVMWLLMFSCEAPHEASRVGFMCAQETESLCSGHGSGPVSIMKEIYLRGLLSHCQFLLQLNIQATFALFIIYLTFTVFLHDILYYIIFCSVCLLLSGA